MHKCSVNSIAETEVERRLGTYSNFRRVWCIGELSIVVFWWRGCSIRYRRLCSGRRERKLVVRHSKPTGCCVDTCLSPRKWRSTIIGRFGEPKLQIECRSGQGYVLRWILAWFSSLLVFSCRRDGTCRLQMCGVPARRRWRMLMNVETSVDVGYRVFV